MIKLIPTIALCLLAGCSNSYQKQDLFHPVPLNNSLDLMPATISGAPGSNWQRIDKSDELRQITITSLTLESDNLIDLRHPYGPKASARLVVANMPNGYAKVALQASDGQIVCSPCAVVARFDDKEPQRYHAQTIGHSRRMLSFSQGRILGDLIASDALIIEIDFYPDGPKQFKFTTSGLTRDTR